ncbi:PREDICTED: syntaxin-1A-like [Amphimedon queenslandica]|uniref:t-SNARE coiled-coil homology domain-containing protein n=1 Tax=Amphimedon queenslandica TaxID=400682 RepID=A0A1X7UHG0_AMPQE|nr:PREDICTED: syntaxin-1A-like [Amphimedon queenslandica]|eukprot:XP_003387901.1 PREDICTED: syntaxin-1A-like [Amphimedon queenslandica]
MAVMTDRLNELGVRDVSPDLEDEDGDYSFEGFFQTVNQMSRNTEKIQQKLDEIKQVQDDIITKPATANKVAKERHAELMDEVKQLSQTVHRGLKRLDEEIKHDELGPNRHNAEFRIKKSQAAALSQKLKAVMLEYNQLEEQHREKCKKVIKRQLQTVDPSQNPSDDKVEELLESQDLSIFTQDILTQTAQKRQALDEVEARKREILQLEENIKELHDMFYDMMLLVESQGDLIDNIQHNVETAAVYVMKGTEETTKARIYASKNRRLKWIICGVVTAVILGIVIAIVIAAAIGASVVQGRGSSKRSLREVDTSESILAILLPSHDTVE